MCIESVWAMLLYLGVKLYEYRANSSLWEATAGQWVFLLECKTARAAGVTGHARCIGAVRLGAGLKRRGAVDPVFQSNWGATQDSEWAYPILERRVFRRPAALAHAQWLTRLPPVWHSVCESVLRGCEPIDGFYVQQWIRAELDRRVMLTDQASRKWRHPDNVEKRLKRTEKSGRPPPKGPMHLTPSQKLYMAVVADGFMT
jgi:hypothetical protein